VTTRTQFLVFVILCALSAAIWRQELVSLCWLALARDTYTHILLILPLAVALIFVDSKALRIQPQSDIYLGATLLSIALMIGGYAKWELSSPDGLVGLSAATFGLIVWWFASVLFCFGTTTVRAYLFPLCFLLLMVPVPESVLGKIIEFLQQQSALATRIMFRLIGVPATQDGVMVSIPGLDIEVAQECSSIRSSVMLVVTTAVFAHLFLRSWWRKALLIIAAVPLSVAKNGLRIFTIAELGTRVDPGFLNGKLHHNGGILFLGVSVVAMVVLLWLLRKSEVSTLQVP